MNIQHINIELIRQDGGTQARAAMDAVAIEEYALAMAEGGNFPPVVVFQEGDVYWLGDGFHRAAAHFKAFGYAPIAADVREGGLREARLFAIGANMDHGIRRTNADKRMAVSLLLQDPEWSTWSNREIARRCGVSDPFVMKVRDEVLTVSTPKVVTVTTPPAPQSIQEQVQEMEREATERVCAFQDVEHRAPDPEDINQQRPKPTPKLEASPDVAELRARVAELEAENAELKEQNRELAQLMKDTMEENASMHRIMDAEDLMAQFKAEVGRFMELARVTTARNNGLINEVNELKGFCKMWRGKYERMEKANKAVELGGVS